MSKVNYGPTSPYSTSTQTSWYMSTLNYRSVERDSTDKLKILEAKYENRPDLLSYDLYGSPNYWWVFMVMNPDQIKDPIYDMKPGLVIYVATANRLISVLGA
jgi:hypothetical protein